MICQSTVDAYRIRSEFVHEKIAAVAENTNLSNRLLEYLRKSVLYWWQLPSTFAPEESR